jgi:preprotein translocase subunit SecE
MVSPVGVGGLFTELRNGEGGRTTQSSDVSMKTAMSNREEPDKPSVWGGGERGPAGWWNNARTFFTEVRNEMRRVTWPSRKEVYATTFVVLLTALFFGLYLYGVDLALSAALNWLYRATGVA